MEASENAGGLELERDERYEDRAYIVRLGSAALGSLVLIAGVLGLLGSEGPLAQSSASSPGGQVVVDYNRFLQWNAQEELQVRARGAGGKAKVAFSRHYLDGFQVQSTSIEPESVTSLSQQTVYTFSAGEEATVTFFVQPQKIGRLRGTVSGPAGSSVSVSQWVYP